MLVNLSGNAYSAEFVAPESVVSEKTSLDKLLSRLIRNPVPSIEI